MLSKRSNPLVRVHCGLFLIPIPKPLIFAEYFLVDSVVNDFVGVWIGAFNCPYDVTRFVYDPRYY